MIAPDLIGMGDSAKLPGTDEESAEYRRPFAQRGEDRRPTLTWTREVPIEHFIQEDSADLIGAALRDWLGALAHRSA